MPKYPQNCVTQNLIVFNLIVYIFVRYCQKHTQPDEARPAVHKTLPCLAREYISPTYTAKNSKEGQHTAHNMHFKIKITSKIITYGQEAMRSSGEELN